MSQAPLWSLIVMLILFPVAVYILMFLHKSLPDKLTFFFTGGLMLSHWLHVWSYRLLDRIHDKSSVTKLNVLFAFSIDWKLSLVSGLICYLIFYILLMTIWNIEKRTEISISRISVIGIASIVASQVVASSVPKLAIEGGLLATYLLGLVAWKYFLSYSPRGSGLTIAQVQSDALTSFGIMLSFVSVWIPIAITFGSFLFQYYQSQGYLGIQFQMTRYAVGVAYSLFGFGIIILETIKRLIKARENTI